MVPKTYFHYISIYDPQVTKTKPTTNLQFETLSRNQGMNHQSWFSYFSCMAFFFVEMVGPPTKNTPTPFIYFPLIDAAIRRTFS